MKNFSRFIMPLVIAAAVSCAEKPSDYVKVFTGCSEYGHCHPCATVPFGMVMVGPESGNGGWDYIGAYQYRDSILYGFSQNRINGTGSADMGDLLVFPFCRENDNADGQNAFLSESHVTGDSMHRKYCSRFDKENEYAEPGYYEVYLDDSGVKAQMSATEHVSFEKFTFDRPEDASVLIDFQSAVTSRVPRFHNHVLESVVNFDSPTVITGHTHTRVWVERTYYFKIEFSKPYTVGAELPFREPEEKAHRYIMNFNMGGDKVLDVKISISLESLDGAVRNISTEIPGWNMGKVRKDALRKWNTLLSRAEAMGTPEQKDVFYTSLYHLFMHPNNTRDCSEEPLYSTLSLWDTFRAAHPLFTILAPEYVDPFINSMLKLYDKQGFLPIWSLLGVENFGMIGDHAVPVIVDAYMKGFDGFDAEKAYNAIKTSLTTATLPKTDWSIYDKYGYFPFDLVKVESVSRTLECCYDDWCAAQMARSLGYDEDYEFFMKRSQYYRNVYDTESGLVRGKDSNGDWRTPFDPFRLSHFTVPGSDYTEGNAWQYNWHIMQDVPGMIEMNGGKERFVSKLDSLFTMDVVPSNAGEASTVDVTGLIGQYAHGNEPSHHVIYLFRMAGHPERTEELIRETFDKFYLDKVDGLCGNDDCGQMSAWYLFSAMGFYPVNPCGGEFVFGAPQLPKITLNLPGGKKFTVIANGLSEEKKYVRSITLNGQPVTSDTISYKDIMAGGELEFEMCGKN